MAGPQGEAFNAGPYTCTLGGAALGVFGSEQGGLPQLERHILGEEVRGDQYGRGVIEHIHQGTDWYFSGVCEEWLTATSVAAINLYGSLPMGGYQQPGKLGSTWALALVMTAVAGTPAATLGPVTMTANRAINAIGHQLQLVFGAVLRTIPVRFQLLPYASSGVIVNFTST